MRRMPDMLAAPSALQTKGKALDLCIGAGSLQQLLERGVVHMPQVLVATVQLLKHSLLLARFPDIIFSFLSTGNAVLSLICGLREVGVLLPLLSLFLRDRLFSP